MGLPSGAAHTQCTVYLQSLTDSGTVLWTATDKDIFLRYSFFCCIHTCIHYFQFWRPFPHHVAVRCLGVLWVAVTGLTASVLPEVPVVRGALVTVMADDVLPASAVSSLLVAVTVSITARRLYGSSSDTGTTWEQKDIFNAQTAESELLLSARVHNTDIHAKKRNLSVIHFLEVHLSPSILTSAVVSQSIAVVTELTVGTGWAISVVQALETLASPGVTWLRVFGVDVAVALTRQALAAGLFRVAIVTRCTQVTAGPWKRKVRIWLTISFKVA